MKPLTACCNGDGRPIQPPSKVLCKKCLAELDRQMHALLGPKPYPDQETA